jgi:hypothetical protein
MKSFKTLILASTLAAISATSAFAGEYGTWNSGGNYTGGTSGNTGEANIMNGQVTLQTQWSNLNTVIDSVGGDAALQGAAAGNLVDIMTMNDTRVNSTQYVGPDAAIGSNIMADISNVWGSVGISNQAVCNGASVSTDPVLTAVRSSQECRASDPASLIQGNVMGVVGDMAIQSLAMGNTFETDSNAPNFPVFNSQVNGSIGASTINMSAFNIGGSMSMTSAAIGNKAQILHYNTSGH